MIKRPPNWLKKFLRRAFKKAISSTELRALIKQAEKDYVYWDTFKHYKNARWFLHLKKRGLT